MPHPIETTDTQTCGKAILVGEHGVVYGAAAIAMPLSKMSFQLKSHLRPSTSPTLLFDEQPVNGIVAKAIRLACEAFQLNPDHIHVDALSQIPIGAGLGSSAALCVGLVRNLAELTQVQLTDDIVAQRATELENVFHGNSSGLDCAVVTYAKPVLYRKGEAPTFLNVKIPAGFILVDSKKRSSTRDMVQSASGAFIKHPELVTQFHDMTMAVFDALNRNDKARLANGMQWSQELLQEVGVVGDMQELIDVCVASGALAAKITGAGGGGCILCFAPHDTTTVVQTLKRKLPFADILEVS